LRFRIFQFTSILGLGLGLYGLQVPYYRFRLRIIQFIGSLLGLGLVLFNLNPY